MMLWVQSHSLCWALWPDPDLLFASAFMKKLLRFACFLVDCFGDCFFTASFLGVFGAACPLEALYFPCATYKGLGGFAHVWP